MMLLQSQSSHRRRRWSQQRWLAYLSGLSVGLVVAAGSEAIASPRPGEATANGLGESDRQHIALLAPSESAVSPSPEIVISQAEPVVRLGSEGPLVEALQKRLTDLGYYSGPVSGYFGELTEAAVIRFQQAQGLTDDGVVGQGTASALRRAGTSRQRPNNPATLENGDQGPAVETLQNELTRLGYYDGPVTGYFGELTEAALTRFQSDKGLTADGIVGPATRSAIDRALQQQSSSSGGGAETGRQASASPNAQDGIWETGEVGDEVATIQRQLQTLGLYSAAIDGDFGRNTRASVEAFQRSRGLTVDGRVGPQTMAALRTAAQERPSTSGSPRVSVLPPSPSSVEAAPPLDTERQAAPSRVTTLPRGISSGNVLAVQQRLQEQGLYNGALDGTVGPETQRAIREAQERRGVQLSDFEG